MRQPELKRLIIAAIESNNHTIFLLENNSNPQIKEICNKRRGAHEALTAVIEALNDDPVLLKMLAI